MANEKKSSSCAILNQYTYSIFRYAELSCIEYDRDSLFNQEVLMKDVLIPAALKDKNGLAIVRVGRYSPLQQTRHLAVIVPKFTQDLDILLKEIENQSDGRSILNPFVDMVGQTLANNTGEFAKEELKKLVPFTVILSYLILLLKTFISELFLNYDLIPDPHQTEPIVDTKAALVMDIGPGLESLYENGKYSKSK